MKKINLKQMLSDIHDLNHILNHIGQGQLQTEVILSSYKKNDNRHGTIVIAKDTKRDELQKIIIDTIDGEPNTTQVKELTYEIGSDCDKLVILYTLDNPGHTQNDYRHEREMTEGFIKVNNDCGHDTYLIKVSLAGDKTNKYELKIEPSDKKFTSINTLPTKQEFDQTVFKVFYNQTDRYGGYEHEEHMRNIGEWFNGTCWYLGIDEMYYKYPVWNEQGLFIQAISISKDGVDNLLSIKNSNLEKYFVNREIRFDENSSEELVMSIKLWEQPLSYFIKQSSKAKERIALYLRKRDHIFCEFWDHRLYLQDPEDECFITVDHAFKELETM